MIAYWEGKAIGVNQRLQVGKGRIYSAPEYQQFIDDLAWVIKPHAEYFSGKVDVRLITCLPKRMDTDAIIKPSLDALERAGVVKDDNQVRNIYVIRREKETHDEPDSIFFYVDAVHSKHGVAK